MKIGRGFNSHKGIYKRHELITIVYARVIYSSPCVGYANAVDVRAVLGQYANTHAETRNFETT